MPLFRTYLCDLNGQAKKSKSTTDDPVAARAAFSTLVDRTEFDGLEMKAVLLLDKTLLATHQFNAPPHRADFWRDRIDEIAWPLPEDLERKAKKPGRPIEMLGGKPVNVYLDVARLEKARTLGDGNVSVGIRYALDATPMPD